MKKIGITGAAGNIGTTLTAGLSGTYKLTLYDVREPPEPRTSRFIKVDCANRTDLKGIFDGLHCLIHLAGNPRPGAPAEVTMRNNFVATSFVFEEALAAGVKKIVYASSNFYHQGAIAQALEARSRSLIMLDDRPTPLCLYADSKVFGENVGRHLAHLGVQFVALRIGWTVPEDDPALYGGSYMRAVFCSKRDLVQAFGKAVEVDAEFLPAFAVSDNKQPVFDLGETRKNLGFHPQDDAENYF